MTATRTLPLLIRPRDVLTAEITKITTYPSTILAAAATMALNTTLGALIATDAIRIASGGRLVHLAQLGSILLAPVYVFALIAVFAAGTEYQGGQLRVTLAAVPDRSRLMTAKMLALLLVTLPTAIVCVLPGRLLAALGSSTPPSPQAVALDAARWIAAYLAFSIIAFGLTLLLRNVIAPVALLTLIPLLAWTGVFQLPELIRLLPHDAGLSLLGSPASTATELPPAVAGTALLGWCLLTTLSAGAVLAYRDS